MRTADQPGFREFWDVFSPVFGQLVDDSTVPPEFGLHLQGLSDLPHEPRSVLDLGCGEGRFSLAVGRHGHAVTALDQDERAVGVLMQRAHEEGLAIDGRVGDFLTCTEEPGRYDVVLVLGCTLIMMNRSAQQRLLSTVSELLTDNGHLLIDMHNRTFIDQLHSRDQSVDLTLGTHQSMPVMARATWWPDADEWVLDYRFQHDSRESTATELATIPSEDQLRDDAADAGLTLVDRMARWDRTPVSPETPLVIHTYTKRRST